MTTKEYKKSQLLPDRIEGATKGKEAVKLFVHSVIQRLKVEYPKEHFNKGSVQWLMTMYFHFTKYLVELYLEPDANINAPIYVVAETSDDTMLLLSNLLSDKKFKAERANRTLLVKAIVNWLKEKEDDHTVNV